MDEEQATGLPRIPEDLRGPPFPQPAFTSRRAVAPGHHRSLKSRLQSPFPAPPAPHRPCNRVRNERVALHPAAQLDCPEPRGQACAKGITRRGTSFPLMARELRGGLGPGVCLSGLFLRQDKGTLDPALQPHPPSHRLLYFEDFFPWALCILIF